MSDIETFKASLNNGKYGSITGARRAIGKFHGVSAENREEMQKIANAYFGEEPKGTTAPKRTPSPKRAVPQPAEQQEEKPVAAKRKVAPTAAAVAVSATAANDSAVSAEGQLNTLTIAIKSLKDIGDSGVDVVQELSKARAGISRVLDLVNQASGAAVSVNGNVGSMQAFLPQIDNKLVVEDEENEDEDDEDGE